MTELEQVGRRRFLSAGIAAIGALISAGFGIPAIAYIIAPALKRAQAAEWLRLGAAAKVELDTPTLFKTRVERKAGWIVDEEEISVYLLTSNGRDFIAMSNICTHLGCRVRWIAAQEQFFCPCHNAAFDKFGEVASGPPPKALDRFEVKVEDGQLFMRGS